MHTKTPQMAVTIHRVSEDLSVDECDAIFVSSEGTHGARVVFRETAAVPHLAQPVIACRVDNLGTVVVQCHCICIILVGIYLCSTMYSP